MKKNPTEVVRIATSNNFNCTDKEWSQLHHFQNTNPDKAFFINCNINTPKLITVTEHNVKVVVTANPGCNINQSEIKPIISRLQTIKTRIAFVRLKYLPGNLNIDNLLRSLINAGFPVVITVQRFNGKASLNKYVPNNQQDYEFSCSRYRLTGQALKTLNDYVVLQREILNNPVWICDQSGLGCSECGLCSKLTTGLDLKISSLNLSSSGICPYNCPDCYAKTMQHFTVSMGHSAIHFDIIKQNHKQSGKTAHIKQNQV